MLTTDALVQTRNGSNRGGDCGIASLFMEVKNVLVLFGMQSCPALFELAGKGFFFFFVVIQNGFDMFGNVIQVMS